MCVIQNWLKFPQDVLFLDERMKVNKEWMRNGQVDGERGRVNECDRERKSGREDDWIGEIENVTEGCWR